MGGAIVKPNFFLIGAPKAGTTSLCELLGAHPDVFICDPKEPGFFTVPKKFKRGYGWYASLFESAAGHKAIGDGSTTYSQTGVYPDALKRLVEYAPDARIIYITRSPLARLESMWIQLRHRGAPVPASFLKALRTWPELIDSGLYWAQINAYRRYFPDERILVLFFEDFTADPHAALSRCFKFLEVAPEADIPDADRPRNVWSDKHEDRIALNALRQLPGYDRLRDALIPRALRRAFKRTFTKPIRQRPQWDEQTRRWVVDRIADDVRRFLEFYGKPADFWPLDAPGSPTELDSETVASRKT